MPRPCAVVFKEKLNPVLVYGSKTGISLVTKVVYGNYYHWANPHTAAIVNMPISANILPQLVLKYSPQSPVDVIVQNVSTSFMRFRRKSSMALGVPKRYVCVVNCVVFPRILLSVQMRCVFSIVLRTKEKHATSRRMSR